MPQLSIRDDGHIRVVTISNPPRGYMNAATAVELVEALAAAEADANVRVIVFTGGVPGVFIRHYDVAEIVQVAEAVRAGAVDLGGSRDASPVYQLFDAMIAGSKPTIAAINGMCMGGGFEFALACDIRVAEPGEFTIGLPETRVDIIPGVGGLQMLARVVGLGRATEMVLRGRVVTPEEAHRLGIVSSLDPRGALAGALDIARELAAASPVAMAEVKSMARRVRDGESLPDGMASAAASFARCLHDDAAMASMRAFLAGGEDITRRS